MEDDVEMIVGATKKFAKRKDTYWEIYLR
jgi:hypothetical protein